MSWDACPKCQLPKDESAWQCDGCGYVFTRDFDQVRTDLTAQLARHRTKLWVSIVLGIVIAGGVVYLATLGFIYVSVPLLLLPVGAIGHALHKISVLREHLRTLPRSSAG